MLDKSNRRHPSSNLHVIAVMGIASVIIGAWELVMTRVASVLFFYDVAYLVLAVSLFGIGVGALIVRHLPQWLSVNQLFTALLCLLPFCYAGLYLTQWAWLFGVFALPFFVFGSLSAKAWQYVAQARPRTFLYTSEMLGALIGLLLLGPIALLQLPINVLGNIGVATHLKETVSSEGLVYHEHTTNSAARTDLLETKRANVRYIFTDGMFVTRSVAWDGVSTEFSDPYIEELARLKRLAFRASQNERVALLGAGAGFDIAIALQEGSEHIAAVEVNADTLRYAERYDDWAGGVLNHRKVKVVQSEARRYLQSNPSRWEHINLTLLQTSPASLRGVQHVDARVLTLEAVQLYLSRLSRDGVLTIIQNTAELAAATQGVLEAAVNFDQRRILRYTVNTNTENPNPFAHLFVVSPRPFTEAEVTQLNTQADILGIESTNTFTSSIVSPATDDRPFLFLSDIRVSMQAGFILAFALLAGAIGLALQPKTQGARTVGLAAMLSGASAMAVQVMAIYWCHNAIGLPTLAMSVALASVLAGSGFGVALFSRFFGLGNISKSGWVAAASTAFMLALMPDVVRFAMLYSNALAAFMLAIVIFIFSLPLGLPFVLIMQYAQRMDHGEAVVVGFDGLGALLGAATATLVTLVLGFTMLAYAIVAGFLLVAVIARYGMKT